LPFLCYCTTDIQSSSNDISSSSIQSSSTVASSTSTVPVGFCEEYSSTNCTACITAGSFCTWCDGERTCITTGSCKAESYTTIPECYQSFDYNCRNYITCQDCFTQNTNISGECVWCQRGPADGFCYQSLDTRYDAQVANFTTSSNITMCPSYDPTPYFAGNCSWVNWAYMGYCRVCPNYDIELGIGGCELELMTVDECAEIAALQVPPSIDDAVCDESSNMYGCAFTIPYCYEGACNPPCGYACSDWVDFCSPTFSLPGEVTCDINQYSPCSGAGSLEIVSTGLFVAVVTAILSI